MKSPTLRVYPDPCLSTACEPVVAFDPPLRELAAAMVEIMRQSGGIGLAANQVGAMLRVIVVDAAIFGEAHRPSAACVMVNPFVESFEGEGDREEGCLSLPGIRHKVAGRAENITLSFQDEHGEACRMDASGLAALCIQHEIDHLNGVTMLERVSRLKADRAKIKLAKARKEKQ